MKIRRTVALAVTTLGFSAAALGVGVTSVSASPVPTRAAAADVTPMAPPPVCVTGGAEDPGYVTQTVDVNNNCAIDQRVKVLVAFAPDSECHDVVAHTTWKYKMDIIDVPSRFDGFKAC